MRDDTLVKKMVSEGDSATASGVTVRTDGGSEEVANDLPLVVVKWDSSRATDDEPHTTFDSYITDSTGDEIGIRHVMKYDMEVDFTIKCNSESERDTIGGDLKRHFLLYEGNASAIHSDAYKVDVGDIAPRNIHMMEPDWYQNGLTVNVRYKQFVADTSSYETLDTVNQVIDVQKDL